MNHVTQLASEYLCRTAITHQMPYIHTVGMTVSRCAVPGGTGGVRPDHDIRY